jgi:hypothetical protein
MNSNEIKRFARAIKLSSNQREIIVGLMLGDGHLETQNMGRTFRLKVEHSISQKDYTDWLYTKLQNLVITQPQSKEQKVGTTWHEKYWFNTVSIDSLRFYGQLFYKHNKKVVPTIISKLVTPLSLAVWFMDDGSLKSQYHRARVINTQCFSDIDLKRLQHMLLKKFSINTTLRKQKEGKQIYIPSTEIERFVSIVRPYIVPSMEYKIKLT